MHFHFSRLTTKKEAMNFQGSRRRGEDGIAMVIDFLLSNARLVLGVGGAAMLGIATLAVKRVSVFEVVSTHQWVVHMHHEGIHYCKNVLTWDKVPKSSGFSVKSEKHKHHAATLRMVVWITCWVVPLFILLAVRCTKNCWIPNKNSVKDYVLIYCFALNWFWTEDNVVSWLTSPIKNSLAALSCNSNVTWTKQIKATKY